MGYASEPPLPPVRHQFFDKAGQRTSAPPITIVYFTFINPEHPWGELLCLQLAELKDFGLAPAAHDIYVELSVDGAALGSSRAAELLAKAADYARRVLPEAKVCNWGRG
jgi:hypothetical protein